MSSYLITSESVSDGHPDKLCDQISDALLDAYLEQDPNARCAIEVMATGNHVIVGGEVSSFATVDVEYVARCVIVDAGYFGNKYAFDASTARIQVLISEQSPEISAGVDHNASGVLGAGDQGLMYGYATWETESRIPMTSEISHRLLARLRRERRQNTDAGKLFGPDAKSQVTILYSAEGKPRVLDTVVLSSQHAEGKLEDARDYIAGVVIPEVLLSYPSLETRTTKLIINPAGSFEVGGPTSDAGLTGRKIIVDTYGGVGRHGGGAFSGKDPSKVDRSGAYAARQIAVSLLHLGLQRVEVGVSYAIGQAEPVSIRINPLTSHVDDYDLRQIEKAVNDNFDLTPGGIIRRLDLLRPIYRETAVGGHFGPEGLRTWDTPVVFPNSRDLRV